jgi:hypothetical protein
MYVPFLLLVLKKVSYLIMFQVENSVVEFVFMEIIVDSFQCLCLQSIKPCLSNVIYSLIPYPPAPSPDFSGSVTYGQP